MPTAKHPKPETVKRSVSDSCSEMASSSAGHVKREEAAASEVKNDQESPQQPQPDPLKAIVPMQPLFNSHQEVTVNNAQVTTMHQGAGKKNLGTAGWCRYHMRS